MPETQLDKLENRVDKLERAVAVLNSDVAEIKGLLPQLATKTDVEKISTKIEMAINGILREALSAVPAKQMLLWTAISAGAGLLGVFLK